MMFDLGADMTNETVKALLMVLIFGSLVTAIHIPETDGSPHRTFLRRARAWVWSALPLTDHKLQPAVQKRESRDNGPLS
jgi:hypothetical protein